MKADTLDLLLTLGYTQSFTSEYGKIASFSEMPLTMLGRIIYPVNFLSKCFYPGKMLDIAKCLFCVHWDDYFFGGGGIITVMLLWYTALIDFRMLNQSYILGINPTCPYSLIISYWVWFSCVFAEYFISIFKMDISLYFA